MCVVGPMPECCVACSQFSDWGSELGPSEASLLEEGGGGGGYCLSRMSFYG